MSALKRIAGWMPGFLLQDVLPRWHAHARTDNGLFFPHLDPTWQRLDEDYCNLVSQSRLLYNFATGFRLTQDDRYLEAVNQGADALARCFADHDHGGWCLACDMRGVVIDETKDMYGHAFVIFGLSHAADVTGREDLKQHALDTWTLCQERFRDDQGGYVWALSRDFSETGPRRSQNPMMHLFEALCALAPLDGSQRVQRESQGVVDFVLQRLVRQDGMLPEEFDTEWHELPLERNGRLDIGHAFEWAYLLSRAAEMGWPEAYLTRADRFLAYGLELGLGSDGAILSPANPNGTPSSKARAGFWEQCEAIRALAHHAVVRGRDDLWPALEKAVGFAQAHCVDAEHGGWFAAPLVGSSPPPRACHKGSRWKVDYHVTGMCAEVLRLLDTAPRT